MKNKNKLIYGLGIASAALGVLGFLFLLIAVLKEYDVSIGHFAKGAVLAPIAYGICIVGVIAAVFAGFVTKDFKIMHGKNAGVFLSFTSALSAILMIASVILTYVEYTSNGYSLTTINYLSVLFGIMGAAALILFLFYGAYRTQASQLLSYAIPVYFIFETLVQYFDKTTAINSPLKILSQLAFVSYAVMTTFDCGLYIGKKNILPKYIFACMASITLGTAVSLTIIVCQFVKPESCNITVVESCLACAFALLAAAKLHHILFSIKSEEKKEAKEELITEE